MKKFLIMTLPLLVIFAGMLWYSMGLKGMLITFVLPCVMFYLWHFCLQNGLNS